jgi:Dual OB-containing domain
LARVEFLCLANSIKLGGRCIAGLRTDNAGWVRAVGPRNSALHSAHYVLEDLSEPRPLDVVAADLAKHDPARHQPENWTIALKPWSLKSRAVTQTTWQLLRPAIVSGPEMLGGSTDRESFAGFEKTPPSASLAVILPIDLAWSVTTAEGKRKTRAQFSLAGAHYDLSVTDPNWRQALADLPDGQHGWGSLAAESGKRPLLTISLGEPFEGDCYKLVAAVIPLKPETADYLARNANPGGSS